jgi:pimeloyl-ACP methyl ester carboxylesterase
MDSVWRMRTDGLHVVRHHVGAPGPPVVIVHGAPDRGKNFAHVVHRLSDVPVTVYDRRGYGRSIAAGSEGGGFAVHADDLIALLDGTPSVVVGQSAGGAIAMLAATKAPELFLALGAWEPPMVPWLWWGGEISLERTLSWAAHPDSRLLGEEFNRGIIGDERWDNLRRSTREMLRAEGEAFRADMACQEREFMDLDALHVPLLIGCGTVFQDDIHAGASHRLAERTGAELFVVDGADHFAHTNHPGAWVELVRRTVALARAAELDGRNAQVSSG